jgi:hypothetical protein
MTESFKLSAISQRKQSQESGFGFHPEGVVVNSQVCQPLDQESGFGFHPEGVVVNSQAA